MNHSTVATNHSLSIAIFLAMLVHIVMIFSITIPKSEPQHFTRDIDVVLVETHIPNDKMPEQSSFLAQENQLGMATDTHKAEMVEMQQQSLATVAPQKTLRTIKPTPEIKPIIKQPQTIKPIAHAEQMIKTPPPAKPVPMETQRIIKPPVPEKVTSLEPIKTPTKVKPTAVPAEKIKPILAQTLNEHGLSPVKEITKEKTVEKDAHKDTPSPEKTTHKKTEPENHHHISAATLQQQISQLGAEVQQDVTTSQTRTKSVNQVTAHKYVAAQYLRDWESKVERTGNMNYPEAATKPGFSAILIMEVDINIDGSIAGIYITRSSGNSELDNAAKKIVEMSAPFPPLPKALREELDVLKITRVWKFSDESRLITQ